jgi:hypothetical protein
MNGYSVSISPQFSLLPESGDQLGAAADVPQLAAFNPRIFRELGLHEPQ